MVLVSMATVLVTLAMVLVTLAMALRLLRPPRCSCTSSLATWSSTDCLI